MKHRKDVINNNIEVIYNKRERVGHRLSALNASWPGWFYKLDVLSAI